MFLSLVLPQSGIFLQYVIVPLQSFVMLLEVMVVSLHLILKHRYSLFNAGDHRIVLVGSANVGYHWVISLLFLLVGLVMWLGLGVVEVKAQWVEK